MCMHELCHGVNVFDISVEYEANAYRLLHRGAELPCTVFPSVPKD
jgi:hypothetical protein